MVKNTSALVGDDRTAVGGIEEDVIGRYAGNITINN